MWSALRPSRGRALEGPGHLDQGAVFLARDGVQGEHGDVGEALVHHGRQGLGHGQQVNAFLAGHLVADDLGRVRPIYRDIGKFLLDHGGTKGHYQDAGLFFGFLAMTGQALPAQEKHGQHHKQTKSYLFHEALLQGTRNHFIAGNKKSPPALVPKGIRVYSQGMRYKGSR